MPTTMTFPKIVQPIEEVVTRRIVRVVDETTPARTTSSVLSTPSGSLEHRPTFASTFGETDRHESHDSDHDRDADTSGNRGWRIFWFALLVFLGFLVGSALYHHGLPDWIPEWPATLTPSSPAATPSEERKDETKDGGVVKPAEEMKRDIDRLSTRKPDPVSRAPESTPSKSGPKASVRINAPSVTRVIPPGTGVVTIVPRSEGQRYCDELALGSTFQKWIGEREERKARCID